MVILKITRSAAVIIALMRWNVPDNRFACVSVIIVNLTLIALIATGKSMYFRKDVLNWSGDGTGQSYGPGMRVKGLMVGGFQLNIICPQ